MKPKQAEFAGGVVAMLMIVSGIVALGFWVTGLKKVQDTYQLAAQAASEAGDAHLPASHMIGHDAWGRAMQYTRTETLYDITHEVRSAGKDGIFGTPDDIVETNVQHNWARSAGRYVATESKEFLHGLVEGTTRPSNFEQAK